MQNTKFSGGIFSFVFCMKVKLLRKKRGWDYWRPYLYVLPSVILLIIFYIYPILNNFYLSFFKWDLINPKQYIALENFEALFTNKAFSTIIVNTLTYMFVSVGLTVTVSLVMAIWLNRPTRLRALVQGFIFTPHIISLVSVSFIWMWLFNENYGLLNYILGYLGIDNLRWLSSKEMAMPSIIFVSVWKYVGYDTLIFIGGLQAIPAQLFEAASLESKPGFKMFWHITLPMLSPTLFFVLIINLINGAKAFDTISIMTQGGPVNATNTLVYYIYQRAFNYVQIGRAAAGGVVLFFILMILTILYFFMLSKRVHYAN
jgi:sn-glycerol 3-phosphate transport system permease protein